MYTPISDTTSLELSEIKDEKASSRGAIVLQPSNVSFDVSSRNKAVRGGLSLPLDNVPADLTERQRAALEAMKQVLEQDLYVWQSFDMELPPTITSKLRQLGIVLSDIFFAPPQSQDELYDLSRDDGGNVKALSAEQRSQLYETGTFEVESRQYPGKNHVWQSSYLLQKGRKPSAETFFSVLSLATREIIYVVPACLFGWPVNHSDNSALMTYGVNPFAKPPSRLTNELSLPYQVRDMLQVCKELFNLFLGWPLFGPPRAYNNTLSQMQSLRNQLEVVGRYEFQPKDLMKVVLDGHLLLSDEYNAGAMTQRLREICQNFQVQWLNSERLEQDASVEYVRREYPNVTSIEFAALVRENLLRKQIRVLSDSLVNDPVLNEQYKGTGAAIMNLARVLEILQQERTKFNNERSAARAAFSKTLPAEYTIRARISEWVTYQEEAFQYQWDQDHKWTLQERVLERVRKLTNPSGGKRGADEKGAVAIDVGASTNSDTIISDEVLTSLPLPGPITEEYLLSHGLKFAQNEAKALIRVEDKNPPPREVYHYDYEIWLPRNWQVEKDAGAGGKYRVVRKSHTISVTTGFLFWQVANFIVSMFTWMNNIGLSLMVVCNICFRSLVGCSAFQLVCDIDPDTGKPIEAGHTYTPWIRDIANIYRSAVQSREEFENNPDEGLIGKSCTRYFNIIWNWVFKFFFGTLLALILFPAFYLVGFLLSFALFVSVPVWVPALRLVFAVLKIIFYDSSPRDLGFAFFPFLSLIFYLLFVILCFVLVLLRMVLAPLFAVILLIAAILQWLGRRFWDNLMYCMVIYPRGRIPAGDSFLARRIAGPGLSQRFFYTVKPEDVLLILQLTLETRELDLYDSYIQKIINQPHETLGNVSKRLLEPIHCYMHFPTSLEESTKKWRKQLSSLVNDRREEFRTVLRPLDSVLSSIRLSADDLAEVLSKGEQLVQAFYTSRIFPMLSDDQESFWRNQSMLIGDWAKLTRKIFTDIDSSLLEPFESTDNTFALKVKHVDIKEYFSMVTSHRVHDDLKVVSPLVAPVSGKLLDDSLWSKFNATAFCYGYLDRLADHYPFTASFAWDYLKFSVKQWLRKNGRRAEAQQLSLTSNTLYLPGEEELDQKEQLIDSNGLAGLPAAT